MIATDVIAALPARSRAGRPDERARAARDRLGRRRRASSATAPGSRPSSATGLRSAPSSRRTATATVRATAPARPSRAGASWLAVAAASEADELRAAAAGGARSSTMGALTRRRARRRARGRRRDRRLATRIPRAGSCAERGALRRPPARPRQVRHAAWDGSASATRTRRRARGRPPPTKRVELAGLWTHFATADEPDVAVLRRAARALRRARRAAPRRATRTS